MRTILVITAILFAVPAVAQQPYTLAPDGTYVPGDKWQITPGGKFISDFGHGVQ